MKAIHLFASPRLEFLHIEEWLIHHINIGIDKFYIYNSGEPHYTHTPEWITYSGEFNRISIKRNEILDNSISLEFINQYWNYIMNKYAGYIEEEYIERPLIVNRETYGKLQQKYNFCRNAKYVENKIEWLANIDGDELLCNNLSFLSSLPQSIGRVQMPQFCYKERYNNNVPISYNILRKNGPLNDKFFYICQKNFVRPETLTDWQNIHYEVYLKSGVQQLNGEHNIYFDHFRGHGYKETARSI